MGHYSGRYKHHSYGHKSTGYKRALEHIREAKVLSKELGGTDEDVKKYFFSLSHKQLKIILDKYEIKYGTKARDYADETFNKWKNGIVHMSGMVTERLFSLMPHYMPLESKFHLVESLWKHVGPSSNKTYHIGLDVDLVELSERIQKHLANVVTHYNIPSSMEARFNWLSQGNVGVKQKLLNHIRQQEKTLLLEALRTHLPVLINHLHSERGGLTTHVSQALKVGKHEVRIVVDERVNGVTDKAGVKPGNTIWIWWIIGFVILLWILSQ